MSWLKTPLHESLHPHTAYNAAEFIGETLASCVQQGLDCIEEIIVINDHSEDDTRGVVERFQVEHADFRIILEDNPTKGACSARNHALRLAQGDAIQWLDADDLLGEGKLEAATQTAPTKPSAPHREQMAPIRRRFDQPMA